VVRHFKSDVLFRFLLCSRDASVAGNGFTWLSHNRANILGNQTLLLVRARRPSGTVFKEFLARSVLLVGEKLLLIHSPSFVTSWSAGFWKSKLSTM